MNPGRVQDAVEQLVYVLDLLPKVAALEQAVDDLLLEDMTGPQILEAVRTRLQRVEDLRKVVEDSTT